MPVLSALAPEPWASNLEDCHSLPDVDHDTQACSLSLSTIDSWCEAFLALDHDGQQDHDAGELLLDTWCTATTATELDATHCLSSSVASLSSLSSSSLSIASPASVSSPCDLADDLRTTTYPADSVSSSTTLPSTSTTLPSTTTTGNRKRRVRDSAASDALCPPAKRRRHHHAPNSTASAVTACAPPLCPLTERQAQLLSASRAGDLARVRELLTAATQKHDLLLGSLNGCTALHHAVFYHHLPVVAELLRHGSDPNARTLSGLTPLHWALDRGASHADLLPLLVEYGADPNVLDAEGLALLHRTVAKNDLAAVELLCSTFGARLDLDLAASSSPTNEGITPLLLAASNNLPEMAELLLARGASLVRTNTKHETAIHKAARKDHHRVLELLLRHTQCTGTPGVLDSCDIYGRTAVHHAAFYGRRRSLELLLAAGATPDVRDRRGKTPLDLANKNAPDLAAVLGPLTQG